MPRKRRKNYQNIISDKINDIVQKYKCTFIVDEKKHETADFQDETTNKDFTRIIF